MNNEVIIMFKIEESEMSEKIRIKQVCFMLVLVAMVCSSVAYSSQQYMLYTEKTLAQAGVVTPLVQQAHFYNAGEAVTITAQPYQGYEFVYWLGDVEEKNSRTTTVIMDGPRYVVAVFEPTLSSEGVEYGMKGLEEGGGVGGGNSLSSNSITRMGTTGVGGYMKDSSRPGGFTAPITPPSSTPATSPTYRPPGDISHRPVIPEPATMTLFGLGALGITARRIAKKIRRD